MASDYIPADDAGLAGFANNFFSFIDVSPAAYGLLAADATALSTANGEFGTALTNHNATTIASQSARAAKDAKRTVLVTLLRSLANRAQASGSLTDAERVQLGITVRDTTPTAVAQPSSQPVLFIGTQNRLQHEISFRDALTPTSKAKPAGVLGCEIYRKISPTPPVSVDDCQFLTLDTSTPYIAEYASANAGSMVHYMARWVNRNGLVGPTSDVISATIVG